MIERPFADDPAVRTPADLGVAVRAARTRAGLTLVEAAELLGISKQTLADLERGRPSVALGTALHVARQLGVSLFLAPAAVRGRVGEAIRAVRG